MTSHTKAELDDKDWMLLQALQKNARLTLKELGEIVNLTSTAVRQRVRQMEKSEIITGYHATVDPAKLGLPKMVFIRAAVENRNVPYFQELVINRKEVLECHGVYSDETCYIKAVVSSDSHLAELIKALRRYSRYTVTAQVTSSPVPWRAIDRYNQEELR